MMRKIIGGIMLGAVVMCMQPAARAAADDKQFATQGYLAQWLVKTLSLMNSLPPNPSDHQCFVILMQNGISPKAGWNSTTIVTRGDLARIVVESLRRQNEVKNQGDDNAWVEFVAKLGIDFSDTNTTTATVMKKLHPLDPVYSGNADVTTTDPLLKRNHIRPPDDQQFGPDLIPVRIPEIESIFSQVPGGLSKPPPPMTPS